MSHCIRKISSKLPPFVGTRKQLTQFDRQLPKHTKSSTFLEEFLGTQNVLNPVVMLRESTKSNKNFPLFFSYQNQSISPLNNSAIFLKQKDQKEDKITKFKQFKELQRFQEPLSVIELMDVSVEDKWRNTRQKVYVRKLYSKYIQDEQLKGYPFTITDNALNQMIPPDIENTTMLLTHEQNLQAENENDLQDFGDKPSQEQLEFVYDNLKEELPFLFVKVMDYTIYRTDLVFVNNIRGVVSKGLFSYAKQVSVLRTIAHLRFVHVTFDILKMTMHPEDATIKVRWRIRGLPGLKVFIAFFKSDDTTNKDEETWYDGFSTFYVDNRGQIFKHIVDKMMPDQDSVLPKEKTEIAAKLALFLGIGDLRHILSDMSSTIWNLGNFPFQLWKGKYLEKAMLKVK